VLLLVWQDVLYYAVNRSSVVPQFGGELLSWKHIAIIVHHNQELNQGGAREIVSTNRLWLRANDYEIDSGRLDLLLLLLGWSRWGLR
jgi:hypothetical protein